MRKRQDVVWANSLPPFFVALGLVWAGITDTSAYAETLRSTAGAPSEAGLPALSVAVEIRVAPDDNRLPKLRDVLGPHPFSGARVRWSSVPRIEAKDIIQSAAPQSGVAVRAWVDVTDLRATRLYFANAAADRFLVRELALSPAFELLDRETLGQVLELSVTALLQDDRAGLSRQQVETLLSTRHEVTLPEGAATPKERPSPRALVEVTAFYAAQTFAAEMPIAQGPGLQLRSGLSGERPRASLWVEGHYQFPQTFEAEGIRVGLSAVALRGGVGGAWRLRPANGRRPGSDVFFAVDLGAGADIVHVNPVGGTGAAPFTPTPPYWSSIAVLTLVLPVTAALAPSVDLAVAPTLDLDLTRTHYNVRVGGASSNVLTPFRVRAGLMIGVTWR